MALSCARPDYFLGLLAVELAERGFAVSNLRETAQYGEQRVIAFDFHCPCGQREIEKCIIPRDMMRAMTILNPLLLAIRVELEGHVREFEARSRT